MSGKEEEPNNHSEDEDQIQQKDAPVKSKNGYPIYYYSQIRELQKGKDGEDKNDVGIAEFYQFAAIIAGGVCYFLRFKWAAWCCLLLFYSSIINFRFDLMMQQGATSFTLVTVAFTQSYMATQHDKYAADRQRLN